MSGASEFAVPSPIRIDGGAAKHFVSGGKYSEQYKKLALNFMTAIKKILKTKTPVGIGNVDQFMAEVEKQLAPYMKHGGISTKKTDMVCDALAEMINDHYGRDVINMGSRTDIKCRKIQEVLETIARGMRTDHIAAHVELKRVIGNIKFLSHVLNNSFDTFISTFINTNVDGSQQTVLKNQAQAVLSELDRQIFMLENLLGITVKNKVGEALITELTENPDFDALVRDLQIDPDAPIGRNLIFLMRGTNALADVAAQVYKYMQKIGLSIQELRNVDSFAHLQETVLERIKNKNLDVEQSIEMMQALMALKNQLHMSKNDIASYIEKHKSYFEKSIKTGGAFDPAKLERHFVDDLSSDAPSDMGPFSGFTQMKRQSVATQLNKQEKTLKMVFTALKKTFREHYARIAANITKIAYKVGHEVPLSPAFDEFIKSLHRFRDMQPDRENLYIALTTYRNDAVTNALRFSFLEGLNELLDRMEPLIKGKGGQYFKDIKISIMELLNMLDNFNAAFGKLYTALPISMEVKPRVGGKKQKKTALSPKRHRSPKREPAVEEAVPEEPAPEEHSSDPEPEPVVSEEEHEADIEGGLTMDNFGSLDALQYEIFNEFMTLKRAIRIITYFYYITGIQEGMHIMAKEHEGYTKNYNNILGEYSGHMIDQVIGMYNNMTQYVDKLQQGTSDWKAITNFYLKFWKTTVVGMIEASQAVDLYMSLFTKTMQQNPDIIKSIIPLVEKIDLVEKFFNERSAGLISAVLQAVINQTTTGIEKIPATVAISMQVDLNNAITLRTVDDLKKWISAIEDALRSVQAFSNVVHLFEVINQKGEISVPMQPGQIMEALIRYQILISFEFKCSTNPLQPTQSVKLTEQFPRYDCLSKILNVSGVLKPITYSLAESLQPAFDVKRDWRGDFENRAKTDRSPPKVSDLDDLKTYFDDFKKLYDSSSTPLSNKNAAQKYANIQAKWPTPSDADDAKQRFINTNLNDLNDVVVFRDQGVNLMDYVNSGTDLQTDLDKAINNYVNSRISSVPILSQFMSSCHTLYESVMKAIVAKVGTVISAYELFHHPPRFEEIAGSLKEKIYQPSSGIRQILGGSEYPEIIDDAIELYIRLILLAEWYRDIFDFKESAAKKSIVITFFPHINSIWSEFVKIMFIDTANVMNGQYAADHYARIIRTLNDVYHTYKRQKYSCDDILRAFVVEVNRRYGLVMRDDINKYLEARRNLVQFENADVYANMSPATQYNLVNTDSIGRDVLPSDRFRRNVEVYKPRKMEDLGNFQRAVEDFWQRVKANLTFDRIRDFDLKEDQFISLKNFIANFTQQIRGGSHDPQSKFRTLVNMLSGSKKYNMVEANKIVDFHEYVLFPYTVLMEVLEAFIPLYAAFDNDDRSMFYSNVDVQTQIKINAETTSFRDLINGLALGTPRPAYGGALHSSIFDVADVLLFFNQNLRDLTEVYFAESSGFKYPAITFEKLADLIKITFYQMKENYENMRKDLPMTVIKEIERGYVQNRYFFNIFDMEKHLIRGVLNNEFGYGLVNINNNLREFGRIFHWPGAARPANANTVDEFFQKKIYWEHDPSPLTPSGSFANGDKRHGEFPFFYSAVFKSGNAASNSNVKEEKSLMYKLVDGSFTLTPTEQQSARELMKQDLYDPFSQYYYAHNIYTTEVDSGLIPRLNNIVYRMITTFLDGTTKKIYKKLIAPLAQGFNSKDIMRGQTINDTDPDLLTLEPQDNTVFFATLAFGIKGLATLSQEKLLGKVPLHVEEDFASLLETQKELMRAYIPGFEREINLLIKEAELYKNMLERLNLEVTDAHTTGLVPSTIDDVTVALKNHTGATGADRKGYFIRLLQNIISTARNVDKCLLDTRRDMEDIPLYWETYNNSIADSMNRNGYLPFMPMSHISLLLRNSAAGVSLFGTLRGKGYSSVPGSTEFRVAYGLRGIFYFRQEPNLKLAPGVENLLKSGVKYGGDKHTDLFINCIKLMNYMADVRDRQIRKYDKPRSSSLSSSRSSSRSSSPSRPQSRRSRSSSLSSTLSSIQPAPHREKKSPPSPDEGKERFSAELMSEYSKLGCQAKIDLDNLVEEFVQQESSSFDNFNDKFQIIMNNAGLNVKEFKAIKWSKENLQENYIKKYKFLYAVLTVKMVLKSEPQVMPETNNEDDVMAVLNDNLLYMALGFKSGFWWNDKLANSAKGELDELLRVVVNAFDFVNQLRNTDEKEANDQKRFWNGEFIVSTNALNVLNTDLTDKMITLTVAMKKGLAPSKEDVAEVIKYLERIFDRCDVVGGLTSVQNTRTTQTGRRCNDRFWQNVDNILFMIENSNYEESVFRFIDCAMPRQNQPHLNARKDLQKINILEKRLVPINFHALQREVPFINLINYGHFYDTFVKEIYTSVNPVIDNGDIIGFMQSPHKTAQFLNKFLQASTFGHYPKFITDVIFTLLGISTMNQLDASRINPQQRLMFDDQRKTTDHLSRSIAQGNIRDLDICKTIFIKTLIWSTMNTRTLQIAVRNQLRHAPNPVAHGLHAIEEDVLSLPEDLPPQNNTFDPYG